MIQLTERQLNKLMRLKEDKDTTEALKVLFLKEFLKDEARGVHELAASKIAIEKLADAFEKLEALSNKVEKTAEENMV